MLLDLQNFRSIVSLSLDTRTDGPGLSLIQGSVFDSGMASSNGAGKTSVMLGLYWTMFGELFLKVAVKDIINNKAKRGASARGYLEMTMPKGTICIERLMSKSKHTVTCSVDGVSFAGDVDVVNQKIIDFFGLTAVQMKTLLMFTGEFSFAGQTDAAMKTVLGSLIPIDVTAALKPINARHATAQYDLQFATSTQVTREADLGNSLRDIESRQAAGAVWDDGQAKTIAILVTNNTANAVSVKEAEDNVAQWEATGVENQEQTRKAMNESMSSRSWNQTARSGILQQIGTQEPMLNAVFDPGSCSVCSQAYPPDKIAQLRVAFDSQLESNKRNVERLHTDLAKYDAEIARLTTIIDADQRELAAAKDLDINNLHQWRQTLQERQQAHQNSERELAVAKAAVNPHIAVIESLTTQTAIVQTQLNEISERIPQLKENIDFWGYMRVLASKSGLAQYAMGQLLPALSAVSSEYLSIMAKGEMTCAFRSENDKGKPKFHIKATRTNGGDAYGQLSSGEQRRIDAAVFVAVNDFTSTYVCPFPVVFVDELLDHSTDEAAKAAMLSMLHAYAIKKNKQIFVISNDLTVAGDRRLFSRVITVRKDAVGSTAEVM